MVKECALSFGNLIRRSLPRNCVDRITDRPDMTLDVDRGQKALTNQPKQIVRKMQREDNPLVDNDWPFQSGGTVVVPVVDISCDAIFI